MLNGLITLWVLGGCASSDKTEDLQLPAFLSADMIWPREPSTADVLDCMPQLEDYDAGTVSVRYVWTNVEDEELSTEATIQLSNGWASPGDEITCNVTIIENGNTQNVSTQADTVVVQNTLPVIEEIQISPSDQIVVASTLVCQASASDIDGDQPTISYAWAIDGVDSGSGEELLLEGTDAVDDSVIECIVLATDSVGGTVTERLAVQVGNTAPVIDSITLSPQSPQTDSEVSCSVEASDVDNDELTLQYNWDIDGLLQPQYQSTFNVEELAGYRFEAGSVLTCTAVARDEYSISESSSVSIVIENTPPIVDSLVISPTDIYINSVANCTSTYSDYDEQPLSLDYKWYQNGVLFDSGTQIDLANHTVEAGDAVQCELTVTDGFGDFVVETVTKDVLNTDPELLSIAIESDGSPQVGEMLSCVTETDDLDGDDISVSYLWVDEAGSEWGSDADLTLTAENSEPDSILKCQVNLSPSNATVQGEAAISVVNTEPVVESMEIDPALPVSQDVLKCIVTESTDADEQQRNIEYRWFIDGLEQSETTDSLSADFDVDSQIRCEVRVWDGIDYSSWSTTTVTIQDTAPTVTSMTILPSTEVYSNEVVNCAVQAEDIDGDVLSVSYHWENAAGTTLSSDAILSLSGLVAPEEVISCTATVTDEHGMSTQESISLTILNSLPYFVQSAYIVGNPSSAYMNETIVCDAVAYDLDDGDLSASYSWEDPNGIVLANTASLELTATNIGSERELKCVVQVTDSTGASLGSSVDISIANSVPTLASVELTPAAPVSTDSLSCAGVDASDADQDTVSLNYEWYIDGQLQTEQSAELSGPFEVDSSIRCVVTPNDGTTDGVSEEATATIQNTLPVIDSLEIVPNTGVLVTSLVNCLSSFSDIDAGTLQSELSWTRSDGVELSTDSQLQLDPSIIGTEDLTCTLTVYDEHGGIVSESVTISLENTPPVWVSEAAITRPNGVLSGQTITCEATATDTDDDDLTIDYAWTVGSTVVGTDGSFLIDPDITDVADVLTCTASATDSGGKTITSTASETVINSTPTVSVTVDSSTYQAAEPLICNVTASDADDQTVNLTYSWAIDGVTQSETSNTLSAGFSREQEVSCAVTPNDSLSDGSEVTITVTVLNTPPVIRDMVLSSSSVYTNDEISISVSTEDDDADSVTLTYSWYVDASLVQSGSSTTLDGTVHFDKDQDIYVEVELSDGYDDGTSQATTPVTVLNSTPVPPTVSLSPSYPIVEIDDLLCNITAGATDADGDVLSYNYMWYQNETPYFSPINNATSDSIPHEEVIFPGIWTCEVKVTDEDGAYDVSNTASTQVYKPGETNNSPANSCKEILDAKYDTADGLYWLDPDNSGVYEVYCDLTTESGGWTLVGVITNNDGDPNWSPYSTNWVNTASFGDATDPSVNADAKSLAWSSVEGTQVMFQQYGSTPDLLSVSSCFTARTMSDVMSRSSSSSANCALSCGTTYTSGAWAQSGTDSTLRFRCKDTNAASTSIGGFGLSTGDNSFITTMNNGTLIDENFGFGAGEGAGVDYDATTTDGGDDSDTTQWLIYLR